VTLSITSPNTDREAWLRDRRKGLGASEVAIALGLSPFKTPLALYWDKHGLSETTPPTLPQKIGTYCEPAVLRLYQDWLEENEPLAGPLLFKDQEVRVSAKTPWLFATLDAVGEDGRVVELKTVGWRDKEEWGPEGTDEVPQHYFIQCQVQAYVAEVPFVDLAALISGREFAVYRIERNDHLLENVILPKASAFWESVVRMEPPFATGADVGLLNSIKPAAGKEVDLNGDLSALAARYLELGSEIKAMEAERNAAKAALLEAVGDAEVGRFSDGFTVVRKTQTRKEHVVKESTFNTFTVKMPKE
jgi:putative phage-type endonuclease